MFASALSLAQKIVSGSVSNFGSYVVFHSESVIYKKSNERIEYYQSYLENILFYSNYDEYKSLLEKLSLNNGGIVLSYLHFVSDKVKKEFTSENISFEEYDSCGDLMIYHR